jgi:hypothetical protein
VEFGKHSQILNCLKFSRSSHVIMQETFDRLSEILTFAGTVHGFGKNCLMLLLNRHEVPDVHLNCGHPLEMCVWL